jgi:hypothetical protein
MIRYILNTTDSSTLPNTSTDSTTCTCVWKVTKRVTNTDTGTILEDDNYTWDTNLTKYAYIEYFVEKLKNCIRYMWNNVRFKQEHNYRLLLKTSMKHCLLKEIIRKQPFSLSGWIGRVGKQKRKGKIKK